MSNFTRISLLVAAAAGLFVCGANSLHLKQKITRLRVDLQTQTTGRAQAESDLAGAKTEVKSLTGDLKSTKTALATAHSEREQALTDNHALRLLVEVTELEKVNARLERDKARQDLARYHAAGLQPEEILQAGLYIQELQSHLTKLQTENRVLHNQIVGLRLVRGDDTPELPPGLRGKVLAFDPKWRFLVLDLGQAQGVLLRGEMLVSRQGKLVAKVKIARVERDRCIANILPNWELGEVAEGDLAEPAPAAI